MRLLGEKDGFDVLLKLYQHIRKGEPKYLLFISSAMNWGRVYHRATVELAGHLDKCLVS